MTLEEMQNKLRNVLSRDRFEHSKNVMNTAVELAIIYRVDKNKAAIAGLLHDCAKGYRGEDALAFCRKYNIKIDDIMKIQTGLLHGPIGSYLAEHEYGIKDPSILRAIFYHTTGCENMDILAKIIYIADYIEPKRNFIGVKKIREQVKNDINKAIILAINITLKHVISRGRLIHMDTVRARNYLIQQKIK